MKSIIHQVVLDTLPSMVARFVAGYLGSLTGDDDDPAGLKTPLKGSDPRYDAIHAAVKDFSQKVTFHTIEEMQAFANMRTPSLLGVHVVCTLVPLSCCNEAATYLIQALGGEAVARRVVGGVKWWQVRADKGVDAEWIMMEKDRQEAEKSYKMKQQQQGVDSPTSPPREGGNSDRSGVYEKDMRCVLYLHGGGYYFGSVSQTRYSSERFARKIKGRVFAINYRLAPQYPFPCGLHDALAAYLFLIRPPTGSAHRPVDPAHIIISGDSAGGGLALALLQVIRDSGLPPPAGGVLISPWCDLTHSFPSIHENTKMDFIPECGLSFHKPSSLWPPPSSDISNPLHDALRNCIQQAHQPNGVASSLETFNTIWDTAFDPSSRLGDPDSRDREGSVVTMADGAEEEIADQLQFYTVNKLLDHPLVSPITGYLGGLPPLLFIAGEEEVLRDEITYTAHKAAYPKKYPILSSSLKHCPHLRNVNTQDMKRTSVQLQIYDRTHHILPILFTFTKPAKFCFRAIANFTRFVTGMEMIIPRTPEGTAGRPQVYQDIKDQSNWGDMIRERVSTSGIIRALEPETELAGCIMPSDLVARLSKDMLQRYGKNKKVFADKFGHEVEKIEKSRQSHLMKAKNETIDQATISYQLMAAEGGTGDPKFPGSWPWRWVLEGERPPPSSLVGRRDTKPARRLATVGFERRLGLQG